MPNILDAQYRKHVLDGVKSRENVMRKNDSLRKFDIYQKRMERYLNEKLMMEYSRETMMDMRRISSINLGARIVNEKASLYNSPPTRTFSTESGMELSEAQYAQLDNLYRLGKVNIAMKKANRYYKLENQCALQWIPKDGAIMPRLLLPHHYDVIPMDGDPERAYCYIISVYDRSLLYNMTYQNNQAYTNYLSQSESDQINQAISDSDDYKAASERYIWWTNEWNFITDGFGNILNPEGMMLEFKTPDDVGMIANPIQQLPFVDVATGKEFEFWVRQGNDVIDFALDFAVLLSDTAEINKRQGYSQALVYSEEAPKDLIIGPHRILHMKLDPNKEVQPKFEFQTPSPDMASALELLESYLRLFLSAEGIDPKTVSSKVESTRFSSGIERLLSLIEKFEASRDDIDLFKWVEQKSLDIIGTWSNLMQGVAPAERTLSPLLTQATLPEDLLVNLDYSKPEALQTKTEIEDSVIKRMENGLMSRSMALELLYGVSEDEAKRMAQEIDQEMMGEQSPESNLQGQS